MKLVTRIDDDSPCPLVGEVVSDVVDEDYVYVIWGDEDRKASVLHGGYGQLEALDELAPYRR